MRSVGNKHIKEVDKVDLDCSSTKTSSVDQISQIVYALANHKRILGEIIVRGLLNLQDGKVVKHVYVVVVIAHYGVIEKDVELLVLNYEDEIKNLSQQISVHSKHVLLNAVVVHLVETNDSNCAVLDLSNYVAINDTKDQERLGWLVLLMVIDDSSLLYEHTYVGGNCISIGMVRWS
ncbi:hypothetical protein DGG96_18085 [Legionella qingyii]|uniref:Uncharacterized protein n=1 Tax=Legionella qingyii TaxID=2184757 RepID=A0A317TZ75_9GAMM|nr:hypothetical protein [Legionella qingyii]PWY54235.1 hypothetical protein DGG96_18085 [Legionella qingyii]